MNGWPGCIGIGSKEGGVGGRPSYCAVFFFTTFRAMELTVCGMPHKALVSE